MSKDKKVVLIQIIGLILFGGMALSSSSSKDSLRDVDWRGAGVGAAAGYNGYTLIGSAQSEEAARTLTANKGYSYYIWDSINGKVYAK